jgi:hypothetical protein
MKIVEQVKLAEVYDESIDWSITFKTNRMETKDPKAAIKRFLRSDERCGHDWDCCGCWFTRVWTHKLQQIGPNTFTVEVAEYRNI